jgi:hypothetical protein
MLNRDVGAPGLGEADMLWIERSLLVRRWRAMKQDVLLHKWYESERAGRDIGWDRALVDWNLRVRSDFSRRFSALR